MIRLFGKFESVVLVIEETTNGVYLYSFPGSGIEGDTWHQSVDDAKSQGRKQFGISVVEWSPVPEAVTNLRSFAKEISN